MSRQDLFPTKELINQYRAVFSSRNGKEVLAHMLYDLGAFQESVGEINETLRNYGLRLLQILSGGGPDKGSIEAFIVKLMKQPLPEKHKERQ